GLLSPSTTYTVTVGGFTDLSGNVVVGKTTTFTTRSSVVVDTTGPSVQGVTPSGGNVPVGASGGVACREAGGPGSVGGAGWGGGGGVRVGVWGGGAGVSGTLSLNGTQDQATFVPTNPLPGGTFMYVSVGGARDVSGNVGSGGSGTFTTASTPDVTAPFVQGVTPVDGATGIAPRSPVTLTFSESWNPATVRGETFALFANGTGVGTSLQRSSDNRTVTVVSNGGLPEDSVVTVVVTSGVQDLSGNGLLDFVSEFTTGAGAGAAGR